MRSSDCFINHKRWSSIEKMNLSSQRFRGLKIMETLKTQAKLKLEDPDLKLLKTQEARIPDLK